MYIVVLTWYALHAHVSGISGIFQMHPHAFYHSCISVLWEKQKGVFFFRAPSPWKTKHLQAIIYINDNICNDYLFHIMPMNLNPKMKRFASCNRRMCVWNGNKWISKCFKLPLELCAWKRRSRIQFEMLTATAVQSKDLCKDEKQTET